MIGGLRQAPTHLEDSKLYFISGVVSPHFIPIKFSNSANILLLPFVNKHGPNKHLFYTCPLAQE